MKLRLDELLVRRDMVLDLKEARGRILAGEVIVNDKRIDKVGQMVPENCEVTVKVRFFYAIHPQHCIRKH